ncbi:amidohydrolase family protein [Actinocrispum wychmicini]|uniref:Amidohydrolase-related domain-containing protein n=1 Tax=Actinocrispum wychmicini TaxID=1213861 RepID=A0A4V2S824_9PSEU|nr:amidohydrolase family protein [Actinocrispum wychmicini]TCO62110.1 hypothetical protein EV192_102247 [Actinocrispum wychmicini]
MTTPPQVVDMCGVYFDLECWESYLHSFANLAPGYLRTFAVPLARHAGIDLQRYRDALDRSARDAVSALLDGPGLAVGVDDYAADLRANGVARQVLHGGQSRLTDGTTVNDRLVRITDPHRDLLEVWAGLDLADVPAAIAELEHCVTDLGVRGASMVHWWADRAPDDPECHRLYARAAELGVPLWIHTGTSYSPNRVFDHCTWRDLDHIAARHPDLVIVAGHGGWPWITEAMAVLQRQPNVYLEFSAHRPKYMRAAGSGWEPMLNYGRTTARHKIMFGSVTWVHSVPIGILAREVQGLDLGAETERAWLHGNAERLLGA